MKTVIITIIDNSNYGNRLQNYAMQSILNYHGYDVETLDIFYQDGLMYHPSSAKWKEVLKHMLPLRLVKCYQQRGRSFLEKKKKKNFQAFDKDYISIKEKYAETLRKLRTDVSLQDYDYFIAGSDQIWNPYFAGDERYFLAFAPPEKRIALMASIGVKRLPDYLIQYYQKNLSEMKYISVREESSADLVEKLTGQKVDCMPDPTLLLPRGDWEEIMKKPSTVLPPEYILSFFLGETPEDKINGFAEKYKLKVVHMEDEKYPEFYTLGPSEFLYVLSHARLVLTDSFHAAVFSIKFHRQFYVFRRIQNGLEDMFSRLETLLGKFHLSERIVDTAAPSIIDEPISCARFEEIDKIITEERKRLDIVIEREIG